MRTNTIQKLIHRNYSSRNYWVLGNLFPNRKILFSIFQNVFDGAPVEGKTCLVSTDKHQTVQEGETGGRHPSKERRCSMCPPRTLGMDAVHSLLILCCLRTQAPSISSRIYVLVTPDPSYLKPEHYFQALKVIPVSGAICTSNSLTSLSSQVEFTSLSFPRPLLLCNNRLVRCKYVLLSVVHKELTG